MRARPGRLHEGDAVAMVAPAGPVPEGMLERGVRLLESWGLRVRLGAHVGARHPELDYLAGTDPQRAADLQAAWCDPDVTAVFCARGGYGCLRAVDRLDLRAMAKAGAKLLVGSSDTTVLHEAVGARLGLVTLFAPMPATAALLDDPVAAERLHTTLFEPEAVRSLGSGHDPLVPGRAQGMLVGGNASLLAATLNTPLPAGCIAALEDVTEQPHRLDRILTQLLRAGWFTGVAGIALGSFTDCGPPAQVRAVVADRLAPLEVPVGWDIGFGHRRGAHTLPLGATVTLDAVVGRLVLDDPPLA